MHLFRLGFVLIFTTYTTFSYAQKKNKPVESFYAIDEQGQGATIEKAKYLIHETILNNTTTYWDTYHILGPLIKTEVFRSRKDAVFNGECVYYKPNGRIDSICPYSNGLPAGTWYFYNDAGRTYWKKEFSQGKLLRETDVLKEDELKKIKQDSTARQKSSSENESDFTGSRKAWSNYLTRNLRYPPRALNNNIQGEVVVQFIINEEGVPEHIQIYKSVEFSLDEEAMRMIRESPRWTPAYKDGKPVKSYKRQPIVFQFK